jgi:hypothetical protein
LGWRRTRSRPSTASRQASRTSDISTVVAADAWRVDDAAFDEALLIRRGQERLIRELTPDAVVADTHFFWNVDVATDLGVPCATFSPIGTFPTLAMSHLVLAGVHDTTCGVVTVPRFPSPDIRMPITELTEFLMRSPTATDERWVKIMSARKRCLGLDFLGSSIFSYKTLDAPFIVGPPFAHWL